MKIENVIIAEGVASDLRGALSLVGFNQRVVGAPTLPFAFRLYLVLTLIDEASEERPPITEPTLLTFNLRSPDGITRFSATQPIAPVGVNDPNVPAIASLAAEVPFSGDSYGAYTVQVTLRHRGIDDSRDVSLYVLSPEAMSKIQYVASG